MVKKVVKKVKVPKGKQHYWIKDQQTGKKRKALLPRSEYEKRVYTTKHGQTRKTKRNYTPSFSRTIKQRQSSTKPIITAKGFQQATKKKSYVDIYGTKIPYKKYLEHKNKIKRFHDDFLSFTKKYEKYFDKILADESEDVEGWHETLREQWYGDKLLVDTFYNLLLTANPKMDKNLAKSIAKQYFDLTEREIDLLNEEHDMGLSMDQLIVKNMLEWGTKDIDFAYGSGNPFNEQPKFVKGKPKAKPTNFIDVSGYRETNMLLDDTIHEKIIESIEPSKEWMKEFKKDYSDKNKLLDMAKSIRYEDLFYNHIDVKIKNGKVVIEDPNKKLTEKEVNSLRKRGVTVIRKFL